METDKYLRFRITDTEQLIDALFPLARPSDLASTISNVIELSMDQGSKFKKILNATRTNKLFNKDKRQIEKAFDIKENSRLTLSIVGSLVIYFFCSNDIDSESNQQLSIDHLNKFAKSVILEKSGSEKTYVQKLNTFRTFVNQLHELSKFKDLPISIDSSWNIIVGNKKNGRGLENAVLEVRQDNDSENIKAIILDQKSLEEQNLFFYHVMDNAQFETEIAPYFITTFEQMADSLSRKLASFGQMNTIALERIDDYLGNSHSILLKLGFLSISIRLGLDGPKFIPLIWLMVQDEYPAYKDGDFPNEILENHSIRAILLKDYTVMLTDNSEYLYAPSFIVSFVLDSFKEEYLKKIPKCYVCGDIILGNKADLSYVRLPNFGPWWPKEKDRDLNFWKQVAIYAPYCHSCKPYSYWTSHEGFLEDESKFCAKTRKLHADYGQPKEQRSKYSGLLLQRFKNLVHDKSDIEISFKHLIQMYIEALYFHLERKILKEHRYFFKTKFTKEPNSFLSSVPNIEMLREAYGRVKCGTASATEWAKSYDIHFKGELTVIKIDVYWISIYGFISSDKSSNIDRLKKIITYEDYVIRFTRQDN